MTGAEMDALLRGFGREQKDLTRILHRVQAEYGCIPAEAVQRIARHLNTTESEIYGVLTFYKAFRLQPGGKHLVTVCQGTSCHVRGGARVFEAMKKELGVEPGGTTPDRLFTLDTVNCFGCCAIGPTVVVDGTYYSQVTEDGVRAIIAEFRKRK
jgi:NADH:ubiquinone oxidoreductase subunit E